MLDSDEEILLPGYTTFQLLSYLYPSHFFTLQFTPLLPWYLINCKAILVQTNPWLLAKGLIQHCTV